MYTCKGVRGQSLIREVSRRTVAKSAGPQSLGLLQDFNLGRSKLGARGWVFGHCSLARDVRARLTRRALAEARLRWAWRALVEVLLYILFDITQVSTTPVTTDKTGRLTGANLQV